MRKLIAAVFAGLTMLAGGAALADGMRGGSIKDAPVAAPTWSGFYLGGGLGFGHMIGKNDYADSTGFAASRTNEGAAGGLATIVLGFDRQVRERYVVGLFTEFDWSNIELQDTDTTFGTNNFTLRSAFSVGGRAGYLMTPTSLLFLTAGYTWAHGKSDGFFDIFDVDTATNFPGKSSLSLSGPFVGLGMETQLNRNFSLRGEVRYTMFRDEVTNSGTTGLGVDFVDRSEFNLLTGRLALTYKFNRD